MNTLALQPSTHFLTYVIAAIAALAMPAAMVTTLFLAHRSPNPKAPLVVRLSEATLLLLLIVLFLWVTCMTTGFWSTLWHLAITPARLIAHPETAVFLYLAFPLLGLAFAFILKSRSNLACVCLLVLVVSSFCLFVNLSSIAHHAPQTTFVPIEAASPIQSQPIPNVQVVIASENLGKPPVTLNAEYIDLFTTQKLKPIEYPYPLTKANIDVTNTQPSIQGVSYAYPSLRLPASLVYTPQAQASPQTESWLWHPSFIPRRLYIDFPEPARQHAPLLAWSILNTSDNQRPAWWDRANAHPLLLWEALLQPGSQNPLFQTYKTWLLQDTFNQGQPFTSATAPAILARAQQMMLDRGLCITDSIELTAALAAARLMDARAIADWYHNLPPTNPLDLSEHLTFPPDKVWSSPNTTYTNLADALLIAWITHNRENLPELASLGNLISKKLVLNSRTELAMLLGGPDIQNVIDRMFATNGTVKFSNHWWPGGGLNSRYHSILEALPGSFGDPFRLSFANKGVHDSYFNTNHPQPNAYQDLLTQNTFAPAKPGTRSDLPQIWDRLMSFPTAPNSARLPARTLHWQALPGFHWRFLSQYMQDAKPERYIQAAKRAVSPRFDQSNQAFIQELGEIFDESVNLPDANRSAIWAALLKAIAARPGDFALTTPVDLSKLSLTRPAVSPTLITARQFVIKTIDASDTETLRTFFLEGMPPDAPALVATNPTSARRAQSIDLILRLPTPQNLAVLEKLTRDSDPAIAAKAAAATKFITHLKTLPAEKLPAPFTSEACTFFDLEPLSK